MPLAGVEHRDLWSDQPRLDNLAGHGYGKVGSRKSVKGRGPGWRLLCRTGPGECGRSAGSRRRCSRGWPKRRRQRARTKRPSCLNETPLDLLMRQGAPLSDRQLTVSDLLEDVELVHHLVPRSAVGKLLHEPTDLVFDGAHEVILPPSRQSAKAGPSPAGTRQQPRGAHLPRPVLPRKPGPLESRYTPSRLV